MQSLRFMGICDRFPPPLLYWALLGLAPPSLPDPSACLPPLHSMLPLFPDLPPPSPRSQNHAIDRLQPTHESYSLLHEAHDFIPCIFPHRKFTIMLVEEEEDDDDDKFAQKSTSTLLRACGYEVTKVGNCRDAWKLLLSKTELVDLVIADVFVHGLSGITLLSLINGLSHLKHVPVIMISSHDSMDVILECLSNGAVDVLIKPLRMNELKNIWQHIWRRNPSLNIDGEAIQSIVSPEHLHSTGSYLEECGFFVSNNTGDDESDACSGTQGSGRCKDICDYESGPDK